MITQQLDQSRLKFKCWQNDGFVYFVSEKPKYNFSFTFLSLEKMFGIVTDYEWTKIYIYLTRYKTESQNNSHRNTQVTYAM